MNRSSDEPLYLDELEKQASEAVQGVRADIPGPATVLRLCAALRVAMQEEPGRSFMGIRITKEKQ